jgi:hypothetical protein
MRKVIVLGSVAAVAVLALMYFTAGTQPVTHDCSPAFQTMLSQSIARLEGVQRQVTAATVGEARAANRLQTVDEYTCSGFRTCDAIATCDGNETCDGEITCIYSTCLGAPTCEVTCGQYTTQGGETCDGSATCMEGCAGWPTYFPMETCEGGATCELTCHGFVSCSGCPTGTERTTWGRIKAEFSQ